MSERKVIHGTGTLNANGTIQVRPEAMFTLGWSTGSVCVQFVDIEAKELYIVERYTEPEKNLRLQLSPLIGQSFVINKLNSITVPSRVRRTLGWELGDRISQSFDSRIKGIIITKVEDLEATEDPLANTVKVSELEATKEEEGDGKD